MHVLVINSMSNWCLFFCLCLFLGLKCGVSVTNTKPRPFFVFGDSFSDVGNNNYLETTARSDWFPFGIDYPTHTPTGRFSNGLSIPDIISEKIGSDYLLPYLNPELSGQKLLIGANFASAGAGVLNDTGVQFLHIIKISRQLELFQDYQRRVRALIGAARTRDLVGRALLYINLGSNDFVNNYYLIPNSPRYLMFNLPRFTKYLIFEYRKVLKRLYDLGARRVLVSGLGPLGCPPNVLAQRSRNGECVVELQQAAAMYNAHLVQMLAQLNREIGSHVFIAVEAYSNFMDYLENPGAYGLEIVNEACCGQGPYNGMGMCTPASNLCQNRDLYLYWDQFHPTEKAFRIMVEQMMSGSTDYMRPMNLSTILALDSFSRT